MWDGSCPIKIWPGAPLSLFNLLIFWLEPLLLILRLQIIIPLYPSIESFRRFYKLMPLHPLVHLIDYWYSRQLCRESPDPLLGCYPTVSFTSKILWVFPWYIIPFVNCIFCFDFDTMLSNSYLLLGWWFYRFVKMPWWVEPMPSLIRVNPRVFTNHTLLVFCQI